MSAIDLIQETERHLEDHEVKEIIEILGLEDEVQEDELVS